MPVSFPADRAEKRQVLLQAVEQVRGTLAAQTDAAEEARTLPDASVAALREAGLFRLKLPAELGGAEADPVTQLEVIEAVTTINPSAGWCMFIGAAIVGMAGAFLPDETIASVFPHGRIPTMAGGLMPGRAVAERGGYRVTGRWSWGSGIRHAEWVLVQTLVERDSPMPEVRAVVFPVAQAQVIDNWHVLGMKGTGSCDYAVADLFVPEAFTFAVGSTLPRRGGPLYLMGWPGYVANEHAAFALGIARCALDAIIDLAQSKKRGYGPQRRLSERAVVQRMIAQAALRLRGTRLVVIDVLEKAWQTASAGQVPGPALQAEMRSAATLATDVALEITTNAFRYGAGSAVRLEHVLQRCLRDLHTAAAHLMVNDSAYENYGQFLLGLPDVDPMR